MTNPFPCPRCNATSGHEPDCTEKRMIVSREMVMAWAEKTEWRDVMDRPATGWPGRLPRGLVGDFHRANPGLLYPR